MKNKLIYLSALALAGSGHLLFAAERESLPEKAAEREALPEKAGERPGAMRKMAEQKESEQGITDQAFETGLSQPSSAPAMEKLKVTGSRISRIDRTGPSPLVIYNKEDLENSGYSSAGDFLRDTTVFHFGVSREEAGNNSSGESYAGIKGETTLILINGIRAPEDPTGGAVDLNLIPLFAIERVEILKDGASALYGSDAVGGVINFITKKDFSGTELHVQIAPTIYPFYKGGSRADGAVVFGGFSRKGSYIGSFHLRFQDSVENSERSWTNKSIVPDGPYGVFNGQVDPKCPEELKTSDGCKFNVAAYSTRLPGYAQLYSYFQGDYKLNNDMTLYSQLIAGYKNNKWHYAPVPGSLKIPARHKMSLHTRQEGTLKYRFMEAGKRDTTYNNFVGDLTVGAKGYISPAWDYDLSLKLAHVIKNETEGGLLLKTELTQAIASGDYDPFNPAKRDLSKARYTARSNNDSTLIFSSLDFSGEAGFWDIDLATGFQGYFKNYDNNADKKAKEKKILSNAGSDGYGQRYVFSYYLEGIKHFSEMLEAQLAGRADYYSDFKWAFNPKAAFKWKPHSQLLFRGSLGTAFIAPPLSYFARSDSEGYLYIFDTMACYNELKAKGSFQKIYEELKNISGEKKDDFVKDFLIEQRDVIQKKNLSAKLKGELKNLSKSFPDTDYCRDRQVFSESKSNKELKETKALVASLGSLWQITEDHSLGLDWWYIQKSGIPSTGLGKKTIDAELKFDNAYVRKKGVAINRDASHKYKAMYNGPEHGLKTKLLNLGQTQKSGLDGYWESDFSRLNLYGGSPYFRNEASYILFSKSEDFPGINIDNIGKFGSPRWRNIATLGWKNERHNVSLTAHTVSSFARKSSELENLPSYTRLDLDYQLLISEKATLKLGWSNLLFSSPPVDDKARNNKLDHDIFEARGPFLFAGLKYAL